MTEDATPVIFPSVGYSYKGLYAYVMGGYAFNGKYAEVDFGVSYTHKWITVGINDYYYPTINSANDQYFTFDSKRTGHWLETVITIAPWRHDRIILSDSCSWKCGVRTLCCM